MKKNRSLLIETIIYSHDIGMEFGIEKRAMLIIKRRKWQTGRNITAKPGKNRNAWREEKLQVHGSIEGGQHQKSWYEGKMRK